MKTTNYLPILPRIGSKFTGKPKGCRNTEDGVYWEVLPTMEADATRLQRGLLKKVGAIQSKAALPKLQRQLSNSIVGKVARKFWAWC